MLNSPSATIDASEASAFTSRLTGRYSIEHLFRYLQLSRYGTSTRARSSGGMSHRSLPADVLSSAELLSMEPLLSAASGRDSFVERHSIVDAKPEDRLVVARGHVPRPVDEHAVVPDDDVPQLP